MFPVFKFPPCAVMAEEIEKLEVSGVAQKMRLGSSSGGNKAAPICKKLRSLLFKLLASLAASKTK